MSNIHIEGLELYGWEKAAELEDHRYNFRSIKKLLPHGCGTVLDAGCGTGIISAKLAALGYEVIGIDAAEDSISLASSLSERPVHFSKKG